MSSSFDQIRVSPISPHGAFPSKQTGMTLARKIHARRVGLHKNCAISIYNTVLLIVCPNVGGGFSPPSESGELYQSLGVFPVGLQCLGQGLVQRVDGGKELIG